jgi:hypothetical protein
VSKLKKCPNFGALRYASTRSRRPKRTNYEISYFWIVAPALKLLYRIGFVERKPKLCKKIPSLNQSSMKKSPYSDCYYRTHVAFYTYLRILYALQFTPIFRNRIQNRIGFGFNGSADLDPGRPNWLPKK